MSPFVVVEQAEGSGLTTLIMNRPEKRNALGVDQWIILTQAIRDLAADESVSCLILTGAGSAFASGGDITQFLAEIQVPDGPARFRQRIHDCMEALSTFPAPTIARVNGAAIGGGMELAICCDVRVAVDTATFGIPAVNFGFVMALEDIRRLVGVVGSDQARFLTMTGKRVDAQEAHRIGLVHEVAPEEELDTRVQALAARLGKADWEAARWFRTATKACKNAVDSQLRNFETESLNRPEFKARVEAFLEDTKKA